MIASFIVPPDLKLSQTRLVCQSPSLIVRAISSRKRSFCPCCHKSSKSVHSRYERTLSDLPVSGKQVKVIIVSRKFFCKNSKCKRKIFTERYATEIRPYYRCFDRSVKLVSKLGLELGGNKGAAICRTIGYPVSPSSVLRIVKQIPLPPNIMTSGTIGVDDWAYKKGRNYGTIIVDLESREVIDLLPDREAGTLAQWLGTHPEVHTVSRDRARTYALGIHTGAPHAIQVADRFHLLVNLRDAFQNSLHRHGKVLKESFQAFSTQSGKPEGPLTDNQYVNPGLGKCATAAEDENTGLFVGNVSPERQYKFQKAQELHQKGYSIKSIANQLGAGRKTIRKYIATESLKARKTTTSRNLTNFSGFESELQRLYSSKTTFLSLFDHIVGLGFNGKYTQFCERMNMLINDGKTSKTRDKEHLPALKPVKTWSTSKLAFMALSKRGILKEEDQNFMDFLMLKSPEIHRTFILAKSFKELFAEKKEGSLREWIEKATSCESGLKRFAKGIESDFEAVNQAVVSFISNGQVEGQVNRLKTIKRKMYGRGGYHLLRKMVLANSG